MKRIDLDSSIIQRYLDGESELTLSKELGISRGTIHRNLQDLGIVPRNPSQSQKLVWQRRTDDERRKQISAAHSSPNRKPPPIITRPLQDRFWEKVRKTESCWIWEGSRCKATNNWGNYGRIRVDGKTQLAHRIAWLLTYGPIPNGLLVLHRCDNPPCVNPSHLFLGTPHDNNKDMSNKGRSTQGIKNIFAVLTNSDVIAIRQSYSSGKSIKEIQQKHKINKQTILRIVDRQTWKHI